MKKLIGNIMLTIFFLALLGVMLWAVVACIKAGGLKYLLLAFGITIWVVIARYLIDYKKPKKR